MIMVDRFQFLKRMALIPFAGFFSFNKKENNLPDQLPGVSVDVQQVWFGWGLFAEIQINYTAGVIVDHPRIINDRWRLRGYHPGEKSWQFTGPIPGGLLLEPGKLHWEVNFSPHGTDESYLLTGSVGPLDTS